MEKTIIVSNESGLHARPAGLLVSKAKNYASDIQIKYQDKIVNAKSIMNLLSLGLSKGSEITIITKGDDEEKALNELVDLLENQLD
ncbi:HPr family phosphocarrier protein [Clostridium sp. D2Q-14]|uniref:HPr family phosphocarrier protein n=1 Tax=Anaeromonas gelatinilytica TaxID=2683194 RepID=UPI00193C02E5|nr:HPr family phosphocarrier protein [Anaeromonas gelatinilytica]MBS4534329.1 HPr family phosphocarrier protein [Anaeromonas gelatinilytica]